MVYLNGAEKQLEAAITMRDKLAGLSFQPPVVQVYDPLDYAWGAFEEYVTRFGAKEGRVLFLGMNPGPWGMTQTGIPFGEVEIVNDWLKITAPIHAPRVQHPQYPIDGYACKRSEVSGRRLWGLFRERFGTPEAFFEKNFVINYCPLLFIASKILKSGKEGASNLTPDKLSPAERDAVYQICDENLRAVAKAMRPRYIIGVGNFAETRAREALAGMDVQFGKILHPSPASPMSNANWPAMPIKQLEDLGIW
ncbi:hypothetical protein LJC40_04730 [Synergistaceae bacterium OttesenSCG-928-D05]|nr:hypothetical protein [Synergistaceae bacterium OttesenSCG-928-D05]